MTERGGAVRDMPFATCCPLQFIFWFARMSRDEPNTSRLRPEAGAATTAPIAGAPRPVVCARLFSRSTPRYGRAYRRPGCWVASSCDGEKAPRRCPEGVDSILLVIAHYVAADSRIRHGGESF